ncbi:MAG: TldD/PmbA family protein [Candidatus Odinarchaeota archaeon]
MFDKFSRLIDSNLKHGVEYIELRFQDRQRVQLRLKQDDLQTSFDRHAGVGIRVLYNGIFGTGATSVIKALDKEIKNAIKIAKVLNLQKKASRVKLKECEMVNGKFITPRVIDPVENHALEEKIELVQNTNKLMCSEKDLSARFVLYDEVTDHKVVVNSDGASFELRDAKISFTTMAIATRNGENATGSDTIGVTGGWEIFKKKSPEEMVEKSCKTAKETVVASLPEGGYTTLILDPATIGLIAHEAIGHACEADSYLAGSIAKEKFNTKVGPDFLTIVDSGEIDSGCGWVAVDDEGVSAKRVELISKGYLTGLMHNRETAAIFDVEPTGNARAWEYDDDPIIRMRNTYIEPGDWSKDEIIEETRKGLLLIGAGGGGEADSDTEFQLEPSEIYEIKNGEIGKLLRPTVISGNALELLGTIDAISKDYFNLNFGSSYCMKQQPIKVDGGGTYLRCKALVGGTSTPRG